jgi:hypothetical protein
MNTGVINLFQSSSSSEERGRGFNNKQQHDLSGTSLLRIPDRMRAWSIQRNRSTKWDY